MTKNELTAIESKGTNLWVMLRGLDKQDCPVLVFNHGGPGSTLMPFSETFDSELLNKFVVVHWDQRGAGKSFNECSFTKDFSVDQFIQDTKTIMNFVRTKTSGRKIYLVGHSWGSLIGIKFATAFPELIDGYIGVGQIIDDKLGQTSGYCYVKMKAEEASDSEALKALDEIGKSPFSDFDRRMKLSNLVMKFGGVFSQVSMEMLGKAISNSTIYSEVDLENQEVGMKKSIDALGLDVLSFNALKEAKIIDIPIWFIQGRDDQATPGFLVEEFFKKIEAKKGKKFVWMEKCGHFPFWDDPRKFAEILDSELSHQ